jgi:hypothetical protein
VAEVSDITVTGTTGRSKLRITTSGARSDGNALMAGVSLTGSAPLGLLHAPGVSFSSINMTGRGLIRSINVGAARDITMPNPRYARGVMISADNVSGTIELGSPLRLLQAGKVDGLSLSAPRAERIAVDRSLRRSELRFTDAQADRSLMLLEVGSQMRSTSVLGASSIGVVRAKTMMRSHVQAGSSVGLASPAEMGQAQRCAIGRLDVGLFVDSEVAAWRIRTVSIEQAEHEHDANPFSLTCHRLLRYNGPQDLTRTLI